MRQTLSFRCAVLMLSLLPLAACDVTTPSQLRTGDIRLMDDVTTVTLDAYRLNKNDIYMISRQYQATAQGPMTVTVAYPAGDAPERVLLEARGKQLAEMLESNRVRDVKVDYVSVEGGELAGRTVLSYPARVARAPANCGPLTGMQGTETLSDVEKYQFSCETKDMMSKMIAYPEDLMGVGGVTGGTSRSAGALMEGYQDGTPNEPFNDSQSASSLGQ